MASGAVEAAPMGTTQVAIPRIAIRFCTQCKWNLRAAYYAQELLQTFSTSIGEISLIPVTGGLFTVTITHTAPDLETGAASTLTESLLWDRKAEGGFPETKELKNRVRNIIDPGRDMGHIDRSLKKARDGEVAQKNETEEKGESQGNSVAENCKDCK